VDDSPSAQHALRRRKTPHHETGADVETLAVHATTTAKADDEAPTAAAPRKRPRTNDPTTGDANRINAGEVEQMAMDVTESEKGDRMEMDLLDTVVLSPAASPNCELLLKVELPPEVEKLAEDAVAANKLVLDHLMAQAKKNAAKAAEKALPPSPEPPIPEVIHTFTPTPIDEFPPVHSRTSTRIFDNLDHKQAEVWLMLEFPHVFVQPLDHGFYPPHIAPEMVHLIRDAIQLALGVNGIKVTAPAPHIEVDRLDKAPFTYLVRGMSVNDADKLATQYCLASKSVGLLVYKAGIQAPTFLGSIEGLTIADQEDHYAVLNLVAQTFVDGPVGTILAEISASNPKYAEHQSTDDRVRSILQTLRGHHFEMSSTSGSKRVNFNVYIESPTDDDSDWARLLDTVHATIYKSPLLGTGFHGSLWNCNTCHGVDHPSGLCPFPLLPGWIKATPHKPISDFRRTCAQNLSQTAEVERAQRRDTARGRGTPLRARGTPRR
jgi:hypothetical protein